MRPPDAGASILPLNEARGPETDRPEDKGNCGPSKCSGWRGACWEAWSLCLEDSGWCSPGACWGWGGGVSPQLVAGAAPCSLVALVSSSPAGPVLTERKILQRWSRV